MREEFFNFILHSCVELIILVDQIKKWYIYSIYTIDSNYKVYNLLRLFNIILLKRIMNYGKKSCCR